MASCYISTGYTLDCRTSSTGGIKTMWILGGVGNEISGYTVTNSQVSAIGGTGTWFKFQLPKQAASLTENLGVNDTAQSVTFQPAVVISLPKLNQTLRNLFFDLVKQNELYIIIKDNNERYWAVAWSNGAMVTTASQQTGQAYNDLNGISVTMTGGEPNPAREIDVTTTLAAIATGFTVQS